MTEALEVQNAQRDGARRATLDLLKAKRRAEREVAFTLNEGEDPVSLLFRAVGVTAYDRLVTANPPNKEQLANGAGFNINTFGPSLLANVVVEPSMSAAEWTEIWNSPEWSGGEVSQLFTIAMELCNRGLDLTPTEAG